MDEQRAASLLTFAHDAAAALRGVDAQSWTHRLEEHFEELATAFDWLIDNGRLDDAAHLAGSLSPFWMASSRLDIGRDWLSRALTALRGTGRFPPARTLFEAGMLAFWQGDDDAAVRLHRESLDTARRIDDADSVATALTGLARVALRKDPEEARRLSEQALEEGRAEDAGPGRSNALHVLGVASQMIGDLEAARRYMHERLDLARRAGDLVSVNSEAGNLSVVERQLGHLDHAERLAREALEISQSRGDEWAVPYDLNNFAAIAVARKDYERATKLLGAAESILKSQGASWPPDEGPHFQRSRDRVRENLSPDDFERAWRDGTKLSIEEAVTFALKTAEKQ